MPCRFFIKDDNMSYLKSIVEDRSINVLDLLKKVVRKDFEEGLINACVSVNINPKHEGCADFFLTKYQRIGNEDHFHYEFIGTSS